MRVHHRHPADRPARLRPVTRRAAGLIAALFLAPVIAGCGSDGSPNGPGDGTPEGNGDGATYSVSVTGAETFVSTGIYALSGGSAAENGWELNLESLDSANPMRSLGIYGMGDRPAPGNYTIVSVAVQAGPDEFYGRCNTQMNDIYYATDGTLTITSSSDDTVEGSFVFSGEESGGAVVSVTGTFRADDLLDE